MVKGAVTEGGITWVLVKRGILWNGVSHRQWGEKESYRNTDMCSLSGLHTQSINVAQLSLQDSPGTFHWGSLSGCKIYASEILEIS